MRFFTDEYYSEAMKGKLLENSHLVERLNVRLDELKIQPQPSGHEFLMEWQQESPEPESRDDGILPESPVTDLSAVLVTMLVGGFGVMFVFDVFLH